MRRTALLLAAALLAGCSIFAPPDPADQAAGMWQERLPTGNTTKLVSLWIQPAGRATLETVVLGQPGQPMQIGRWSFVEPNQLTVQLEDTSGKPQGQPLVYDLVGDRLIPKRWDHALYGDAGLPLRRRVH